MLYLLSVLWKRIAAMGGKLVLCNLSSVGKQVIKTSKLDSIWAISPSREEALASMQRYPPAEECENLLVPWALSATHIAFGSIRMEPVFMILGQSAATAACIAIDDNTSIQAVPYDRLLARLVQDGQKLE